ncbi:MBL fold metallo-hydrolase [Actinacidiphila epipremni]|uniref:MBL fold metallo-hydrolase n=1 Tax=Actinacidiphila epipremni TaxID=2053013 RepID=A0ABX0ZWI0_9ACTN|nr:MBL fold metallo-hydrolase [Actinacidiphila epipremni]NJP46064.1 MBL fold metallo-hydrolase [Actinacidiphila epipremni]
MTSSPPRPDVAAPPEPAPTPDLEPPYVQALAPGVHAFVQPDGGWCLGNAGIVAGDGMTALIDTAATEHRAGLLRDTVTALTPHPPTLVVTTHHHGDHHFGNALFAPAATIVASTGTRDVMTEKGTALRYVWPDTPWGDLPLTLPTLTFDGRLTLHVGGIRVELYELGIAHTTSDTVAWLPEQRVLFAGDVVLPGCTPFVLAGSVAGSLAALEQLRALGPTVVVGGHGPVAGPEALDEAEAYLRWVRELAARGVAEGVSPYEAAVRADLGPYAELRDPERLVANLHRAYAEAAGLPPDHQIRSAPVFEEMARFNGGRPLTCRA